MGKGKKGFIALAVASTAAAAAATYAFFKKRNAKVSATFVSSFDENDNEFFKEQAESLEEPTADEEVFTSTIPQDFTQNVNEDTNTTNISPTEPTEEIEE